MTWFFQVKLLILFKLLTCRDQSSCSLLNDLKVDLQRLNSLHNSIVSFMSISSETFSRRERFDQRVAQTIKNAFEEVRIEANQQVKEVRLVKKHAKRVKQQVKQARLVETARLAEKCRLLAKQQANKTRAEEVRLVKKQTERLAKQVRIEKKRVEVFACKRCNAKFSNNTKLHQHVQDHHQKKSTKFADEIAISTSSESALMLASSIDQSKSIFNISLFLISSATSLATSKKSTFWVEITSRSVISSKSSRLSISTSKSISKARKISSDICSSTSQKSTSKYQKSHLTIDDLFEMFAKKFKELNLLRIKKNSSFSRLFHQVKITFYFRSAVNQSKSISQSLKTSNSRSFQQHTFAKSIRNTLNKWLKKSIISSYKISIFFRLFTSENLSVLSYKLLAIFDRSSSLFTFRVFHNFSTFSHFCRICCDTFESNNDLHRHIRAIHFNQESRHCQEKSRESRTLERNVIFRRFLILWRRIEQFSYFLLCITNRFLMNESHVFVTRHNENVVIFFVRWHLLRIIFT